MYLPPVTVGDDLAIELQTVTGLIDVCLDLTSSGVRPHVCVGYEAGAVSGLGSGSGLSARRRQTAFWQAVQPEVGLTADLSNAWFFDFGVAAAVALNDAAFVFDAGRIAHDLPRVSLRAAAGLGWRF